MISSAARRAAVVVLALPVLAGCGGDHRAGPTPADQVRDAARAYLVTLRARDWPGACGRMTATARRDVEDAAGAPCARALAAGAALPADQLATADREVAGAAVRIRGAAASIGPLGGLPQPLRMRRVAGRWLVAG